MGADAHLYLPLDVNDIDLAEAMGALKGAERQWETLSNTNIKHFTVAPTKTVPVEDYSFRTLEHTGRNIPVIYFGKYYHITGGHKFDGRLWLYFSGSSYAPNIALFRRLAKIFGGIVVPYDGDEDTYEEYKRPADTRGPDGFYPDDDEWWDKLQRHLYHNSERITKAEILEADKVAQYKLEPGKTTEREWADAILDWLSPAAKAWKTRKAKMP